MKYIKSLILFGLVISIVGCEFEEELSVNPNELNENNFFQIPEEINSGVIAGYGFMTTPRNLGGYGKNNFIHRSDELSSTHPMTRAGSMNFNQYNENYFQLQEPWQFSYNAIYAVNAVIENIDKPSWTNTSLRDAYLGEAHFLRAYAHYYLFTNYRNIIVNLNNPKDSNELFKGQSTPSDTWDAIIEDLKTAKALLPVKGFWPDKYKGRVTKGSATGLLGKAYLYRSGFENENYYNEAASEFNEIINGSVGSYSLVAYEDNFHDFNENNNESIFELQFRLVPGSVKLNSNFNIQPGSTTGGNWSESRGLQPMGNFPNGNAQAANDWLLEFFQASTDALGNIDPRVFGTLIFDDNGIQKRASDEVNFLGRTGFIGVLREKKDGQGNVILDGDNLPVLEGYLGTEAEVATAASTGGTWNRRFTASSKKWINNTLGADYDYQGAAGTREGEPNLRVIRYADVLLMYAEAVIMGGSQGSLTSLDAINLVRQRPGIDMPPLASANMDDLKNERILELSCEGHRIYDLIRWGTLESTFLNREASANFKTYNGNAYGGISGKTEKYKWYPIPSTELNTNPSALQNEAWR